MERPPNLASAVEAAAEALVGVLDDARSQHPSPVSPTQLRVLSLINGRPDTNVNKLAELLQVVPSSASRLCDRLEAIGLIRRVPDQRDRREVHLLLTGAAQTLLGELRERRCQALQVVLDAMPTRAQHDLLAALLAFAEAATPLAQAVASEVEARTA
ncbi:MarR family winged helix-turn-helix transcriptional regulator [Plantactinospora siamensis]|uniref:MarR family winged helix-turn-helix transcriptional regulator n=1 Tax=Plantactinospora siamensis TaxID=555372 RepID=A0ABV6NYJ7_9ACTN